MTAARTPESCARAGFTLVEVLVASALLAVGLLAIITVHRAAMLTMGQTSIRQAARNCALSEIDRLRASPFANLPDVATTTTTSPAEVPGATLTVVVAPYPDNDTANLRRVTVTVAWPQTEIRGRAARTAGQVVAETLIVEK